MNYYEILGISKNATKEEIKNAYRKCAMKYHPDKCLNDSTATEKMKNVNVAFETLSDENKKMFYDMTLDKNEYNVEFDWSLLAQLLERVMNLSKKDKEKEKEKEKEKVQKDIIEKILKLDIIVDFHEICAINPPIKKMNIKVIRYTNDKKKKIQTNTIYIPLINYKDVYMFENEGDEIEPGVFGDIQIRLIINPVQNYHIDELLNPHDLYYDYKVSLYDYFYGFETVFNHIDGVSKIDINFKGGMSSIKFNGYGLSYIDDQTDKQYRGDLYIMFTLELPRINPELEHVLNSNTLLKQYLKQISIM